MRNEINRRPTIGLLSTWAMYEGTSLDSFALTLLRGVTAAARARDCNLLLGCGISRSDDLRENQLAWSYGGSSTDFIPVGPWNADGLIVLPDDLSESQSAYIENLINTGYPIIMTAAERQWPMVTIDNIGGIRKAIEHLVYHGHRRIAFIAGKHQHTGDTLERLQGFRDGLRAVGLAEVPELIVYGEHRMSGGRLAMKQLLACGEPFTAMIASNDLSCLGALEVLVEVGLRVPEDVAVIGFDDRIDAQSSLPPLTTIRHPTFDLGYQAVVVLHDLLMGRKPIVSNECLPTQLVVRQSCGCSSTNARLVRVAQSRAIALAQPLAAASLARAMAEATLVETRYSTIADLEAPCLALVQALVAGVNDGDALGFTRALAAFTDQLDQRDEDVAACQTAVAVLRDNIDVVTARIAEAQSLLDEGQLLVSESERAQAARARLRYRKMTDRLGLMTSQLLSALDISESASILTEHLGRIALDNAVAALYIAKAGDPFAESEVVLSVGLPSPQTGRRFATRQFPPPEIYPPDMATQVIILPLVIDGQSAGFVALSMHNVEPAAAIAHHLAAALRSSQLYHDALEGRRQAEEISRLKSRFLSMVSHELRTPLSLIVGLSDILLHEQREALRNFGAVLHDLEQIQASAMHLGRLIGDVLDLANSEAGQLYLYREQLDLSEIITDVARLGEQLATSKALSWRVRLPMHGPYVYGDRTRLRQVVLNLVSNAVSFTERGEVLVEVLSGDDQSMIRVSDTGIGIPLAEQERIFEEFHRVEQLERSGYSGLGLGLAVCKQLILQHHGTIAVRSPGDLGRGTTFIVSLPVLSTDEHSPEQGPALTATQHPFDDVQGEQRAFFIDASLRAGTPLA